ncbi:MAG: hypothetical protein PHR68_04795, partial [Candidatus Gracilibacteria bacterium]|nr:hypothetical protein [Candidatus Gracilibacteria bacterium]
IIDKAFIFKVMTNQYLKFVSQNKSLSGYKPLSKFKVDGPFSFEIEVSDGFRKGNIVLEIVDEAKLRENKDFLESQI